MPHSNEAATRLSDKTCVITGATAGIGQITATAVANAGARVIAIGRDPGRVERLIQNLRASSNSREHAGFVADLSSQAEIRRVAAELLAAAPRIDLLINNAGAMTFERQLTIDGIEQTFAVNHLAYFLLTNLLLDRLKASAPSRIINVASDAHRTATANPFGDIKAERPYRGWRSYCNSKLANVLFTSELARRLEGTGVTANSLHPGFVRTNFFHKPGFRWKVMGMSASLFAISPEAGAATTIYLATSPEVEGVSGKYFAKSRAVAPSKAAQDEAAAQRLWSQSAELTGLSV